MNYDKTFLIKLQIFCVIIFTTFKCTIYLYCKQNVIVSWDKGVERSKPNQVKKKNRWITA